jgi:hypothetical protein
VLTEVCANDAAVEINVDNVKYVRFNNMGGYEQGSLDSGNILALGVGSIACGNVGGGGEIMANGVASYACGVALAGETVLADGEASFAHGANVQVNGTHGVALGKDAYSHDNSFVFGDGSALFGTVAPNQFAVQATGNVRLNNGATTELITTIENDATTWNYVAGNSSNWATTSPDNLAEALDRLAAAYTSVHGAVP